jgi:hypothetical protein
MKNIPALKGEEITSLVGVSCMKRRRMGAFIKNFKKKKKG